MQVILVTDVKGLGKKGTIVNVNDSYARNYIIPHGLGVEANKANLNDLKLKNANTEKLEAARVANAKDMKAALDGKTIEIAIKTGKDGKLFGSVTNKEIADAIKSAFNIDIDKKKIAAETIKTAGDHPVNVKLHKDISANMIVRVSEG